MINQLADVKHLMIDE